MPASYRETREYSLVHSELVTAAQDRGNVTYTQVARILNIDQPGHNMARKVGLILGEISEDEVRQGRPMLSALAVGTNSGVPSPPFYVFAQGLGQLQDNSAEGKKRFLCATREALYETWDLAKIAPLTYGLRPN